MKALYRKAIENSYVARCYCESLLKGMEEAPKRLGLQRYCLEQELGDTSSEKVVVEINNSISTTDVIRAMAVVVKEIRNISEPITAEAILERIKKELQ